MRQVTDVNVIMDACRSGRGQLCDGLTWFLSRGLMRIDKFGAAVASEGNFRRYCANVLLLWIRCNILLGVLGEEWKNDIKVEN